MAFGKNPVTQAEKIRQRTVPIVAAVATAAVFGIASQGNDQSTKIEMGVDSSGGKYSLVVDEQGGVKAERSVTMRSSAEPWSAVSPADIRSVASNGEIIADPTVKDLAGTQVWLSSENPGQGHQPSSKSVTLTVGENNSVSYSTTFTSCVLPTIESTDYAIVTQKTAMGLAAPSPGIELC